MSQILVNSTNTIYTTTLTTADNTLSIAGENNFPLDIDSLASVFNTTRSAAFNFENIQFNWFRANGLPIYQWIFNVLPASTAGSDVLNLLLNIPQNQSNLTVEQKIATGSAGTPGTYVGGETPTGTIDGTNKTFTLAFTPNGGITLLLTPSGGNITLQQVGSVNTQTPYDYTISGNTITFVVAPPSGTSLFANYYH